MIVVDSKTIPVRCNPDIAIAKRTIEIYTNGSYLFVRLVDVFSKIVLSMKFVSYYNKIKNISNAVNSMTKCLNYIDNMLNGICDRIYKPSKFKVGGYEVNWEQIFRKLEIDVYETKDYIDLTESLYKSELSYAYKMFFEFKGNKIKYNEAVSKILDKIEWICKWSMNVATVVSNSLIGLNDTLYKIVYKILDMYYDGKISEKSMSYAIADIDDKINEIINLVGRLSEVRWMFRYSYVYVHQLRILVLGK